MSVRSPLSYTRFRTERGVKSWAQTDLLNVVIFRFYFFHHDVLGIILAVVYRCLLPSIFLETLSLANWPLTSYTVPPPLI